MVAGRNPTADLTDDLLVEILSWLPARQLCRFKRVSRAWRDLISHPDHRRRLAQPLVGVFHRSLAQGPPATHRLSFTPFLSPPPTARPSSPPLAAVDPSFPFLPSAYSSDDTELLDSCNGLLLLRCRRAAAAGDEPAADPFSYVVCNPTTEEWVELPQPIPASDPITTVLDDLDLVHGDPPGLHDLLLQSLTRTQGWKNPSAALAFDPAVSRHSFHVFLLMGTETFTPGRAHSKTITAVQIYSSETGRWALRDRQWGYDVAYDCAGGHHAYHDGFLHITTADKGMVASVDTTGQEWRITRVPPNYPAATLGAAAAFLGRSQRRLLFIDTGSGYAPELSVYALECCGGAERWVVKHRTRSLDSSTGRRMWFGKQYSVMAIHPDLAVIFLLDSRRKRVVAYDMDHGAASIVHTFTDDDAPCEHRYFPYVPLYAQIQDNLATSGLC
ncbi:unnamed protein product [Urochloa humidicola]